MRPNRLFAASIAAASLSLVACTGGPSAVPGGTSLDQSALSSDASGILNSLSDFETSLSQQSAEVSSAEDTGAGATIQSLSFGAPYTVQADVDVNLGASFNFGTGGPTTLAAASANWTEVAQASASNAASASLIPAWMKIYPRTQAYGTVGAATQDIYVANSATTKAGPFAYYNVTTHEGTVVDEEFAPEMAATDSLTATNYPSQFQSVLPASYRIRQAQLNFFTYGSPGSSAVGYRWAVHDVAQTNKPQVAWIRALKISRPNNVTVNHYDISTAYVSEPDWLHPALSRRLPTEIISDDLNVTTNTHYHMDKTYTASNTTWTGNGYWVGTDGVKRTIVETWNIAQNTRTRTVSWTGKGGAALVMSLNYAADRSGTGTLTANGTQFATMSWGKNGVGKMTLTSGQTLAFKTHY